MTKTIQFRFTPFSVSFHDREVALSESEVEMDLLSWCSLPDILFEGKERRFVGLSFPVDVGKEAAALAFTGSQKSELLRCLSPQQAEWSSRYSDFGRTGRLEMMWAKEVGVAMQCEFASLFNGAWRLQGPSKEAVSMPTSYVLMDIQNLLDEHGLKLP
jgi:hypothetical protein